MDVLFRSIDVLSCSIDVQNIIGIELKQCTFKLQESTSILQKSKSKLLTNTNTVGCLVK